MLGFGSTRPLSFPAFMGDFTFIGNIYLMSEAFTIFSIFTLWMVLGA